MSSAPPNAVHNAIIAQFTHGFGEPAVVDGSGHLWTIYTPHHPPTHSPPRVDVLVIARGCWEATVWIVDAGNAVDGVQSFLLTSEQEVPPLVERIGALVNHPWRPPE
jgi:hypothetical protein